MKRLLVRPTMKAGNLDGVIFTRGAVLVGIHNLVFVLDNERRMHSLFLVTNDGGIVDASHRSKTDAADLFPSTKRCRRCDELGHNRTRCTKSAEWVEEYRAQKRAREAA